MLAWFDATHQIVPNAAGGALWQRVCLPGPGGVGDQDARVMESMDWLHAIEQKALGRVLRRLAKEAP